MADASNQTKSLAEVWGTVYPLVECHFADHDVPEHHGMPHALAVAEHALTATVLHRPKLSDAQMMWVRLAALLHDTGDRKYFGDVDDGSHARALLEAAGAAPDTVTHVVEMIGWVSFHKNGNDVPAGAEAWQLIPRWADRLESIGLMGAIRCAEFSAEHERPQIPPGEYTPPARMEEFLARATAERLATYRRVGESKSTLDHFWDKLLHIPAGVAASGNNYLVAAAKARTEPLYVAGYILATEGVDAFWANVRDTERAAELFGTLASTTDADRAAALAVKVDTL
jgi:HD superfamily phosphodiesterase